MKTYTVNVNGNPVRSFAVESEAREFMLAFSYDQQLQQQKLDYIDAAVDKSDLSDALAVIEYIMKKANRNEV